MSAIATVSEPDFNAAVSNNNGVMVISLTGNADLNVKNQLDSFLVAVHEEARRQAVSDVEVDVRKLEFMNSSCLKSLVGWISRIQDEPAGKQYRVLFRSSPQLFWQRRSLHALSCLASDLVSVQT
jgi:anti-anti-sigma factor